MAHALNDLGDRYGDLGRREDALPPFLEAMEIRRSLASANPASLSDLAVTLDSLVEY
nr:tetratricopeptide repeat protein [Synechococcus sp. CCAP 1479/9]